MQRLSMLLADNFPALAQNIDTVNHLANYLQKTSFFRNLQPYVHQKSLFPRND